MIGICMKYEQHNYGGMLQAQALCREFEKRNIDYELVRYVRADSITTKIRYIPRLFNTVLLNDKKQRLTKKLRCMRDKEFSKNDQMRARAFKRYSDRIFVHRSPGYHGFDELCKGAGRYSAVVVGSDQLWSPAGLPTNYFNLMFVPDAIRKISVASSFGVKQIPWYQISRTREYLKRIEFVSMRENHGAEIVRELTGRKVPVVADPVFLLSQEEWEEIIPPKKIFDKPYVFAYFLGQNKEHRDAVKEFAARKNIKIVTFHHVDQYNDFEEGFGDYAPFDVEPDMFLNLLRGAEYVFTDSLHGTIFSVIHQKNFVVFDRYSGNSKISKNSRIDSLCENLEVEFRRYKGNLTENLNQPLDYEHIKSRTKLLVESMNKYLDEAFDGIK